MIMFIKSQYATISNSLQKFQGLQVHYNFFTNYALLFKVQKIITLQSTKVQITPMEIPNTMIYQVPSSV